jgi:hypothetical protein
MSAKKPERYGKGMRSISTTLPVNIFNQLKKLAKSGGLKHTAWARHALIDSVRSGAEYGVTDLKKLHATQPAEAHGDLMNDPSAESDGGSSTAKQKNSLPIG